MKNFLSAVSLLLGLGLASAQQVHPATTTGTVPPPKVVKADDHKKPMPAQAQYAKKTKTVSLKSVAPKPAPAGMKLKKDGTPDKRYKQNQHLKKDGTPDKRFKTNK